MAELSRHEIAPFNCPGCDKVQECATGPQGVSPKAGDLMICLHCGYLLLCGGDGTIAAPSAEQLHEIQQLPNWPAIEASMRRIRLRPWEAAT